MAEQLNKSLNAVSKKSKNLDKEVPLTDQIYDVEDTIVAKDDGTGSHFTAPVDYGIKEPSESVKKSLQKAQLVQAGGNTGATPFGRVRFEEKDLDAVKHVENVQLAIEFYRYVIDYFFKSGDEALIAHGLKLFPNIKTMVSRAIKKQHELQHKVKMLDVFKIQDMSDAVLSYKIANGEITRADLGLVGPNQDINVLFPSSAAKDNLDPSKERRQRIQNLTIFGRDQYPYGPLSANQPGNTSKKDFPGFLSGNNVAGDKTVTWNPLAKTVANSEAVRSFATRQKRVNVEAIKTGGNDKSSYKEYVDNMITRLFK